MNLHLDVLDKKRHDILPLLASLKNNFYLAGGTALALLIGHRDSIDFDFFTPKPFSTAQIEEELKILFVKYTYTKVQDEENTLTVILNEEIKISFFTYPYLLLQEPLDAEYFRIASVVDIGCMKLSAIVSRSTLKDYVDLYYILQDISLEELLQKSNHKHPQLDRNLILKSLVYFDDIDLTPLHFMPGKEVSFDEIKKFFTTLVATYMNNHELK